MATQVQSPESREKRHQKGTLWPPAHTMAHVHIIVNKNFKENLKLLCIKGYYQKDKLKKNQEKHCKLYIGI